MPVVVDYEVDETRVITYLLFIVWMIGFWQLADNPFKEKRGLGIQFEIYVCVSCH